MTSSMTDVYKIGVTLSEPEITVEPGSVRQLLVTIVNRQAIPDRLSLELEGIDVEWYSMPEAAFYVAPGGQAVARVNFKIARNSSSLAGVYPFLVRVQAMETGEVGVAQAAMAVAPFSSLQMELNPKRAVATYFGRYNDFEVTLANLGNTEETLDLFASDPDDGCAYEFDTERVTLKPGQSAEVLLGATPKSSTVLGGMRLYGFTVSARSVRDSYISATAHGQLETRALISPLLGIFLLLLATVTGGFFIFRPAPPQKVVIHAFNAIPTTVSAGEKVTLSWDVQPANSLIKISYHVGANQEKFTPTLTNNATGSLDVEAGPPQTTYTLKVQSGNDSQEQTRTVIVLPPPVPPTPVVKNFIAMPPTIHIGEKSVLSWEGSGIDKFILDPGNIQLGQYQQSNEVDPAETTTYRLRGIGRPSADGQAPPPVMREIVVKVVSREECTAVIDRFVGRKGPVYIGDHVRLSWKTRLARSAHIDTEHGEICATTDPAGSHDVVVTEPTSFTLTVEDSLGNKTAQTISVTPIPRPTPPPATGVPGVDAPPAANGPSPVTPPTGAPE